MDITVRRHRPLAWRGFCVLLLLAGILVTVGSIAGHIIAARTGMGWGVNITASEPVGLYRTTPVRTPLAHNALVVVTIPPHLSAVIGRYVTPGVALIKQVGAIAGDRLTTTGRTITRCDRHGQHCRVIGRCLTHDSAGRALHCQQYHHTVVPSGKVYLMSHGALNAFDSRYFGWVSARTIIHRAYPVWVW